MEIFQSTTLLVINVFENEEVQRISNQFCVERGWNIEDDRCQSVRNSLLEEEHRMRTRGDGGAGARGAIRYNLILENDVSVPFQVRQTMATVDGDAFPSTVHCGYILGKYVEKYENMFENSLGNMFGTICF